MIPTKQTRVLESRRLMTPSMCLARKRSYHMPKNSIHTCPFFNFKRILTPIYNLHSPVNRGQLQQFAIFFRSFSRGYCPEKNTDNLNSTIGLRFFRASTTCKICAFAVRVRVPAGVQNLCRDRAHQQFLQAACYRICFLISNEWQGFTI